MTTPTGHDLGELELRAVQRAGIIDVGSNSVRMVVFDGATRSPAYFYNEKIMCGLGSNAIETGRLDPTGRRRALAALRRFALLVPDMKLTSLSCVATAAVREAVDGAEFCREVREATGLELTVVSGTEEARLAAQGVLLGWPEAEGLVCDIGGSSMELAEVSNRQVGRRLSTALGPLAIERMASSHGTLGSFVEQELSRLRGLFGDWYRTIHLVGGSCRVFARLDMERSQYPLQVLNEYRMSCESVIETADWIAGSSSGELKIRAHSSSERIRLVSSAAVVLKSLVEIFRSESVSVSAYGIREGLLYDSMHERLRERDPLIEACLHAERASSRLPGNGDALFKLLWPIFKHSNKEKRRLMRAACLLHDVTWRAHPDYRAEICFDNATRANLGGLDHSGRVFLALALFHRYKNSRSGSHLNRLTGLLAPEELKLAEILGKAMRFGAMLGVVSPDVIRCLKFIPRKRKLVLVLPEALKDIYGEVVAMRFAALAQAMDCEPDLQLVQQFATNPALD